MIVLILEKVSTSLRGELTRWMIQPKAGIFVGRLSARVRDRLWDKVRQRKSDGAAILIYPADTEQGFAVRTAGKASRTMEDFDGIYLAKKPVSP